MAVQCVSTYQLFEGGMKRVQFILRAVADANARFEDSIWGDIVGAVLLCIFGVLCCVIAGCLQ